ncbi:SOS response-associated peptidase family protein [Novosphingobium sp.]|jgi:putative SOS response-associated peptidase YedK|uniref:SOS response-associated peptidase n=1 Tax=Novosphingobium sp. TaxID=1874826 RepID=UPI001ED2BA85|nr:SOS response-associated peptidase family protein [Novosphingobium sp.]MBK6800780.1 SOS response-associated peptidase family protein [Novosphingobium sp.]MBK9011338.1 SOS response-associated peptidase family protein [Novosphingobium sp.]
MCNLYRMTKGTAEVAKMFEVVADLAANYAQEVYPGYPGLVIAEGRARAMHWGFPLVLKGRQGQPLKPKPVTNAREDKLLTPFWRDSFAQRRCLVPVSQWAEAEGAKGHMTRTWYGLPGEEVFAVAGLWRASAEWGDVYTLVMVDGHPQMAEVHDRMPLILSRAAQRVWLDGSPSDALALCRTWEDAIAVERTGERWAGGGGSVRASSHLHPTLPLQEEG